YLTGALRNSSTPTNLVPDLCCFVASMSQIGVTAGSSLNTWLRAGPVSRSCICRGDRTIAVPRLLINHLTRMKPPYICVAGLNERLEHVRAVLPNGRRWKWDSLREEGGPLEIGAVVRFDSWRRVGSPPEVEDHLVPYLPPTYEYRIAPAKFKELMARVARPSLE